MATVVTDHRDSSNAWNFGPAMEGAQPRDRIADHMGTVLAHGCSRVGGRAHTPTVEGGANTRHVRVSKSAHDNEVRDAVFVLRRWRRCLRIK